MASVIQFVDSIPPDFIQDAFGRTVVTGSGWGYADGAVNSMRPPWGWEGGSATSYDVTGGVGRIIVRAVNTPMRSLVSARCVQFDQTVTLTVPVVTTGGPLYIGLYGLYGDINNNYKAELVFNTNNSIDIRIRRSLSGVTTTLASASTGLTYSAGNSFKIRFQYTNATTWRAMAWAAAGSPPANFMVTATDAYGTLQSGRCGPSVVADSLLTNTLPLTVTFDDYSNTPEAGTLLDLMSSPWTVTDAFDISPPPIRRAESSTLLRDGSIYPATAYDNRSLGLVLTLNASSPDASATELQKLMKLLNRASAIIRWQMIGQSKSVYFRTFRSSASKIDEHPQANPCGSLRHFTITVPAEPFAYGPQQMMAPVTVNNDFDTGTTNPQSFDVAAADVIGDVDTPMIMRIKASDVAGLQSLIFMRRTRLGGLFYGLQMETGVNQTDTTSPGHDAAMSGGAGNNYTRTSFASDATLINRVTFSQFPPSPFVTTSYRGKYRVLLRYRKSVAGDVINARLLWDGFSTGSSIVGKTVTLVGTTELRYADLGLVSIPTGQDPVEEGYSGLPWPASGVPVSVQAQRVTGSGNLDMDGLVFVPADDSQLFVTWPSGIADYGVVDSITQMVYEQNVDPGTVGPGPIGDALGIPAVGVFPMLSPGVVNRVGLIPDVGTVGSADSIATTATFSISYYPRYLYVRPLST